MGRPGLCVSKAYGLKRLAQLILGKLDELQENGQAVTAKGRETTEQPPLNFVVGAHREAFAAVANKHLAAVVAQLLAAEGIQDVATWCPLITQMGQQAAQALSPSAMAAHGVSDPRHYIKVGAAVCKGCCTPALDSTLHQLGQLKAW